MKPRGRPTGLQYGGLPAQMCDYMRRVGGHFRPEDIYRAFPSRDPGLLKANLARLARMGEIKRVDYGVYVANPAPATRPTSPPPTPVTVFDPLVAAVRDLADAVRALAAK